MKTNGTYNRSFRLRRIVALATLLLVWTFLPAKAHAAGLLIADGGFGGVLEIKEHEVDVTVNNGIAVTTVTQVFHNTENRQVEALYTFPVPKGASVSNFSMWINGKEMIGEVLEKERARQIYNSYKRRRKDPGLLEQVDYKTFEMRIFPIAAGADQKVQITYYQELGFDHDMATYVYPLATVTREGIDSRTTGRFAMNVKLKSAVPITDVKSPSHADSFVIVQHSESYTVASLETPGGSLASDVVLNLTFSRPKTGIDLIASRMPGEDGYFLLTLTAGEELVKLDKGMDYVFVLDVSGSMASDRKLSISQDSLDAFINELGDDDRFEVMTFNVSPNTLFGELQTATTETKERAGAYMNSQRASGGTNLSPAMSTAYKYVTPDRTLNVIILSDGMTEQKERHTLMQLIKSRPQNTRVFCIGIGNEVNRPLLEQIAEDSGGLVAFISRGDNFKRQAKAFRRKLLRPAATDIEISFGSIHTYDLEPRVLPNLYHGSPVRLYGRYSGHGPATVTVSANIMGREVKRVAEIEFPEQEPDNPELERMWAWKRVDQLLKQADRSNSRESVINEIIGLGEEYSIVTEYTSFIVLENDAEYRRWKIERKNALRTKRDRTAQAKRQELLDGIRDKAISDIGPQKNEVKQETESGKTPQGQENPPKKVNQARKSSSRSLDFDFSPGSGPVGPAFVAVAYWLRRRRSRK